MRILISTGDYSADLHGEALVRALRGLDPTLHVSALGGVKLKGVCDDFIQDMVELDVSGFSQPVKQFFKLKDILQKSVFPRLESKQIDAVVLIDYYGFNIHVAEKAKALGIPVFYFVSPQVWASRKGRVRKLKRFVTRMLVIFPFEETLYQENGVPVEFVGHPLMDAVADFPPRDPAPGAGGKLRLGLMPGSRWRELTPHIPVLLESAYRLSRGFKDLECTLFAVEAIGGDVYRTLAESWSGRDADRKKFLASLRTLRNGGYAERQEMALCIAASGTVTLENALLGIPMVVIYKTSWLTYWVAKQIIRVPYISMPNILSGREVVPELIQDRADPGLIAEKAGALLARPEALESMRGELIQLRAKLGPPGAYERAAKAILKQV